MKHLPITLTAAALATALAAPAQAATLLGAKVGADAWFADADVNSVEANDVDTTASMYVALEHFIPLVPNAKVRYTSVSANQPNVEFDQLDLIAYYEILDNDLVSFDIGVNFQQFSSGNFQGHTFDEWQPNLYGDARIGIPGTPLSVFGTLSAGNYDGTSTLDGQAGVEYNVGLIAADLNLRGGYRIMDYEFDYFKGANDGKFKQDGFFVGAEVNF